MKTSNDVGAHLQIAEGLMQVIDEYAFLCSTTNGNSNTMKHT